MKKLDELLLEYLEMKTKMAIDSDDPNIDRWADIWFRVRDLVVDNP